MDLRAMPQTGPHSDDPSSEIPLPRRRRRARRPDLDRTASRYFIYWLYDDSGQCLYVGRSCDVPARLRTHLAETDWATSVRSLDLSGPYTWDEAVAAERAAIEDHQPPHNRMLTEKWTRERYTNRARVR